MISHYVQMNGFWPMSNRYIDPWITYTILWPLGLPLTYFIFGEGVEMKTWGQGYLGAWKSAVLETLFFNSLCPLCHCVLLSPQSIDSVQFLHLGFNKLRQVPQFGSRARYNLGVLNLRNNELINIDGGWGE